MEQQQQWIQFQNVYPNIQKVCPHFDNAKQNKKIHKIKKNDKLQTAKSDVKCMIVKQ